MLQPAVPRPFPHALRNQRDRRHEVEHAAACAHLPLRQPEGGRRLAGAAGQDELAAVVFGKAVQNRLDRLLLVLTWFVLFAITDGRMLPVLVQFEPVHLPTGEFFTTDERTNGIRLLHASLRRFAGVVAGPDEIALGKDVFRFGSRDESVDSIQVERCITAVEFALDRRAGAIFPFRHDVNAGVLLFFAPCIRPGTK